MKNKLLKYISIIFVSTLLLLGCDLVQKKRTIQVVTSASYKPFSFVENGKIIGFEIDLVHIIADKLGYKTVIRDVSFGDIMQIIQHSKADLGVAAIIATPERKQIVDFSTRYYDVAKFAVLYNPKVLNKIKTSADFQGKKIGVIRGSVQEDFLQRKDIELKKWQIILYGDPTQGIDDLGTGVLDGFLWEDIPAKLYAKMNQLDYIVIDTPQLYSYAIAFPMGSFLTREFNDVLVEMEVSGKMGELKEKWGLK